MLTTQQLIQIVDSNELAMKCLLLHLDLLGEIELHDRLHPMKETAYLLKETEQVKPLEAVELWIDEWRDLFNILNTYGLSMGLGNKQNCIDRMNLFMTKVSNTSDMKERVMTATRRYLQDCIEKGRTGRKPEFFILPQGDGKISNRDIRTGDLYEWYTKSDDTFKDISIYDV